MRGSNAKEGDTRTSKNGYHYTKTKTKWELTGRLIGGKKLGRPLLDTERIKYVDNDRTNLSEDNIEVYVVREAGQAKRRARIEAKIEELQNELEELDAE